MQSQSPLDCIISRACLSTSLQVSVCDAYFFLAACIFFLVNLSFFPVVMSTAPAHSECLDAGNSFFTPLSDI